MSLIFQNKIPCACGCGEFIDAYDIRGRKRKFSIGHTNKGKRSPNWKGGVQIDAKGYRLVWNPTHPRANVKGYVFEHILVLEQKLGRSLLPHEQTHHINHNKQDNRPENLINVTYSQHQSYHVLSRKPWHKDMANRQCCDCNRTYSYRRRWYYDPLDHNRMRCCICYNKLKRGYTWLD